MHLTIPHPNAVASMTKKVRKREAKRRCKELKQLELEKRLTKEELIRATGVADALLATYSTQLAELATARTAFNLIHLKMEDARSASRLADAAAGDAMNTALTFSNRYDNLKTTPIIPLNLTYLKAASDTDILAAHSCIDQNHPIDLTDNKMCWVTRPIQYIFTEEDGRIPLPLGRFRCTASFETTSYGGIRTSLLCEAMKPLVANTGRHTHPHVTIESAACTGNLAIMLDTAFRQKRFLDAIIAVDHYLHHYNKRDPYCLLASWLPNIGDMGLCECGEGEPHTYLQCKHSRCLICGELIRNGGSIPYHVTCLSAAKNDTVPGAGVLGTRVIPIAILAAKTQDAPGIDLGYRATCAHKVLQGLQAQSDRKSAPTDKK